MMEDQQLLSRYTEDASEAAFQELVTRHVNLVYSVALREVYGDQHLAQDVAQLVFVDLARKARSLRHDVVLAGWLHRATRYAARQTLRAQRRRRAREEHAIAMNAINPSDCQAHWEQIGPELDQALDRLNRTDRDALVLRYFSQCSFADIGAALGSNEDSARKRVTRALAKLRLLLERRGVTTSATALSALLAANAVQAAPVGLATTLSSASIAASASAGGIALTFLELMTMTKLKTGLVSAIVIAGLATPLVLQHQSAARLREENNALRSQVQALAAPPTATILANADQPLDNEQHRELLRLRGEVGQLRKQTNELDALRSENRKLRASAATSPNLPAATATPLDFPREAWSFVGYAEPAAAFQSMIWSLSNGRVSTALGSFTPEQRAKMIAKHQNVESKSEDVIAAEMVRDMQHTKRFQVLEQQVIGQDEVQLRILVDGERTPETVIDRRARMKKIDGEWRFDGWVNQARER